jgi:hypothetical protein
MNGKRPAWNRLTSQIYKIVASMTLMLLKIKNVAERVGFEPTYSLLGRISISSRARYDRFGTSPKSAASA